MRPGGLLLNGDRIAYPAALPAFCGLADRERERLRQAAFIEQGGEDYRQWWAAIEQGWHTDAPRFSRSSTPTAQRRARPQTPAGRRSRSRSS